MARQDGTSGRGHLEGNHLRVDNSGNPQIAELVRSVFNLYSNSGQMDDTPLTFNDLSVARKSFERVLQNIYHPRVLYPGQKKEQTDEKSADKSNKK